MHYSDTSILFISILNYSTQNDILQKLKSIIEISIWFLSDDIKMVKLRIRSNKLFYQFIF